MVVGREGRCETHKTPFGSYRFVRPTANRIHTSLIAPQTFVPSTSVPDWMSTRAGVARRKLTVSLSLRLAFSRTEGFPEAAAKAVSLELKVDDEAVVVTETTFPWMYERHLLAKMVARSARRERGSQPRSEVRERERECDSRAYPGRVKRAEGFILRSGFESATEGKKATSCLW